ncbi:uncharacterized protein LOC114193569 isoform X2 [Vigna unguiculata]|uniref:uncharacterized protein LOC114193569 isoform X2 n=1 Tax=Vigna unguiculata TaxID=3917 RepID=UPI0010167B2E|nr:uncharacterized protein LOC114193569 isoform X2 [Vigna unguiculata]
MSQSHLNNWFSDCSSSMEFEIGATDADQTLDAIAGKGIWCKEQNLPSCYQKVEQFPMFSTTAPPLHDCGIAHKKRSMSTRLSSTTLGDAHEAAIKQESAQNSYASGQRKKIAYPFKLVKCGGVGGETTLKDINYQILSTPSTSKAIPHPVTDSVTLPCKLVKGSSFGLSGKTVTSLTRIHTRGRGSITIIRTKDS